MSHYDRQYIKTQIETTESDIRGADSDTLKVLDDKIDLLPASSGTVTFNATALASVNAEVDTALNTTVPLTPTGGSLNDIISKLDGANTFDNTTDSLEAISDKIDTLGTTVELAKVPKSDSTVTWNSTALASINAEVDTALNTTVPLTPTGGSLNDIVSKLDGANTYDNTTDSLEAISDKIGTPASTVSADIAALPTVADVNTEVDTALNTIVPVSPTAGSLNDALSKAAGGNTFVKATDSLEALADTIALVPQSGGTTSWNSTALASVNAEVDTALNTTVPLTPTGGRLNDIISKLDGANTFDNTTDSLEAISDKIGTPSSSVSADIAVVDGYHDVPTADATTDAVIRDVVGRKTDTANTTVGTTSSLMRYVKGILNSVKVGVNGVTTTGVIVEDGATGVPSNVNVITDAVNSTFGVWTEIDASASADSWICSVTVYNPNTTSSKFCLEIGTGTNPNEATKIRFSVRSTATITVFTYTVPIPIKVASGVRIAARASQIGAGAVTLDIGLQMYQSLET